MFFERGSAHNGRSTPILRKTQLDHDINLPPKFYQDRIKTHGAMLGTDRQTDRQAGRQTDRQTDRQTYRHTHITNIMVTYWLVNQKTCFNQQVSILHLLVWEGEEMSLNFTFACMGGNGIGGEKISLLFWAFGHWVRKFFPFFPIHLNGCLRNPINHRLYW